MCCRSRWTAPKALFAEFLSRFRNLSLLFEQADTTLTPAKFFGISRRHGGWPVRWPAPSAGINAAIIPVFTILAGVLPLVWLMLRRRRRLRKFAKQLPDALELIARALRAGHSLAAGFQSGGRRNGGADRRRIQPRVRRTKPRHSAG